MAGACGLRTADERRVNAVLKQAFTWSPAFAPHPALAHHVRGPECKGGFPHVLRCPVRSGRSDAPHDRSGRAGAVPSVAEPNLGHVCGS
jgi:hypothetical protein